MSLKPTTPLTEADRLAEAAAVIPIANLIDLRQNRAMIFLGGTPIHSFRLLFVILQAPNPLPNPNVTELKSKWTGETVAIADGKLVWALQPKFAQMNGGVFNSKVGTTSFFLPPSSSLKYPSLQFSPFSSLILLSSSSVIFLYLFE